ncbi:MAG: HAD family hydrolase [Verrucomicrobiota bacterium]
MNFDALFAKTAKLLEVEFDEVITAEQVRQYKPSPENFRFALKRLGVSPRHV